MLGSLIALSIAAGAGARPVAASDYYRLPDCVHTYPNAAFTVAWRNGADEPTVRRTGGQTPWLIVGDDADGDHWSLIVLDGLTGKELWRKDGLGPREDGTIPQSVWTPGGVYLIKTERWLKDGRQTSSSTPIEITDQATYERLRGVTYGLSQSLTYALSLEGAVSARATLRDTETGTVVLATQLYPEAGYVSGGHPVVRLRFDKYLDATKTERLLALTWEELDSAGRTLKTEADPVLFKLRAPLKPTWKQGGGQVIEPTGTIEWEPVEGARWYQLSVPGEAGGAAIQVIVPGTTTQYQFSTPLSPGFHWVSLAAEGGGCRQDWADALPAVVDQQPFHGILSPTGGSVTERDLTVKLRRADWINGYQVELLEERDPSPLATQGWSSYQAGETIRFATDRLVPGRTYRLRATATLTIPVTQVETVTFTYNPPVRLAFKQALQGAQVAKESLPLSWDPVPGATSYTLLLTRVSTFVNLQSRHPAGTATSLTLGGQELESGRTYRIAIEATMADGAKLTSDPVTFSVK